MVLDISPFFSWSTASLIGRIRDLPGDHADLAHRRLGRLWYAVNVARPHNGFIRSGFAAHGWTAQPDYSKER